jgi:hypothetical protein
MIPAQRTYVTNPETNQVSSQYVYIYPEGDINNVMDGGGTHEDFYLINRFSYLLSWLGEPGNGKG